MLRFFLVIAAVSFSIVVLVQWAAQDGWIMHRPSLLTETLILLVFSTVVIFRYLYKAASPSFFVQLYLGTIAIKLLAYGAYCFWMVKTDTPGAALNVGFFVIVYFVFTGLEIAFLYRKISGQNRP